MNIVTFEQAKKLKELGFGELLFVAIYSKGDFGFKFIKRTTGITRSPYNP